MRKYDLKGLQMLTANVSEQLTTARDLRRDLMSDLARLDTAESKSKYTPTHIAQRKSQLQRDARDKLQQLNKELAGLTKTAAKERPLWSKSALLIDSYQDSDATDRGTRAVEQSTAITRGLMVANRLSRMSDDQFKVFVEKILETGDTQALILASEEGELRGGLSGLAIQQAVDSLPCEEAEEAAVYYASMIDDLSEAAALERTVENPDDNMSYARIRSAEISRATAEAAADGDKKDPEGDTPQKSQDAPDLDFRPKPLEAAQ